MDTPKYKAPCSSSIPCLRDKCTGKFNFQIGIDDDKVRYYKFFCSKCDHENLTKIGNSGEIIK